MRETSVNDLLETSDCRTRGCPNEAGRDGLCDYCRRFESSVVAMQEQKTGWSKEQIVDAVLMFYSRHGRFPGAADWQAAAAVRGGDYPSQETVRRVFRSWQDPLDEAQRRLDDAAQPEPEHEPDPEPVEPSLEPRECPGRAAGVRRCAWSSADRARVRRSWEFAAESADG